MELFFMKRQARVLILTVGYGHGHRSAAEAIAERFHARGVSVRIEDPCEADTTGLYAITKEYYQFCVRRAPWLWSVAYSQTETADWHSKVKWPIVRRATAHLRDIIRSWRPDVVISTYPLFAYMVDYLRNSGLCRVPSAVVVTDAIEISKPWVKADFDALFVPDEFSADSLINRYGLNAASIYATGFPVRSAFVHSGTKELPNGNNLQILLGVHINPGNAVKLISLIFSQFPFARTVVLAGTHYRLLQKRLCGETFANQLTILETTDRMSELLSDAHLYIGKTGAATMFECYASGVPVLANYALPGQEQGNLELLLRDGCGYWVDSVRDCCDKISELLSNGACQWQRLRNNMFNMRRRVQGAERIVDIIIEKYCHEK